MQLTGHPLQLTFLLSSYTITAFLGCTKHAPDYVPPNAVDSFVKDPDGSLYIAAYDLYKLDVRSGVTEWNTFNRLVFDSWDSPMYFDSGYVYFGGLYGIAAYNYQSGQQIWLDNSTGTAGMGGDAGYRALAIKDSLAIYAGSTGVGYGLAHMYCIRKKNGTLVWQNLADSTGNLSDFNAVPYIAGSNVVMVTRNYNGDLQLAAYDPITGTKVWASANNDDLNAHLLIGNNVLYNINNQHAYCYSTLDGSLLWTKDLGAAGNSTMNCFLDGSKLIVANSPSATSCTVGVYNTADGSLLSSSSFAVPGSPTNAVNFNYGNNVLYATNIVKGDTLIIHAFDINAQKEKWSYLYNVTASYGNVLTPDFLIVPEMDSAARCNIAFLNVLNGSVVKRSPFPSSSVEQMLYVDSTGVIYRQP